MTRYRAWGIFTFIAMAVAVAAAVFAYSATGTQCALAASGQCPATDVLTLSRQIVANNDLADADSQVKGDTDANLTYWDASTDRVGIGTATPGSKLTVSGTFAFTTLNAAADLNSQALTNVNIDSGTVDGATITAPTMSGIATGTWVARWSGGTAITAAQYEITRDADATNQLHFNVPTGATYEWSTNDISQMVFGAGVLYLGDTSNANMAAGVTVNQAGADNQIFAGKSSDVATGLTTGVLGGAVETDDFYTLAKISPTEGGVYIQALAEDGGASTGSFRVEAAGGTPDTTDVDGSRALVEFTVREHDGANAVANSAAGANIFGIRGRTAGSDAMRFLVKANGDTHVNGTFNATTLQEGGVAVPNVSDNLSVFAATTSAQLAGVISDETGSGVLVFGTSPNFTTSVTTGSTTFAVFNATATTINAFGAATTINFGAALTNIGDTSNANMAVGVTVNQAGADNQIFAGKSSDVATGLTTGVLGGAVETDDFYTIAKASGTEGGVFLQALAEDGGTSQVTFGVEAYGGTPDTTDTAASRALVEFTVREHDGANAVVNSTTTANIFGIRGRTSGSNDMRFLVKANGDVHVTNTTLTALDHENDIALIRDMRLCLAEGKDAGLTARYGSQPLTYPCTQLESMGFLSMNTAPVTSTSEEPVRDAEGRQVYEQRQQRDATGRLLYEPLQEDVVVVVAPATITTPTETRTEKRPLTRRQNVVVTKDVAVPVEGQPGRFVVAKQDVVETRTVAVDDLTKPVMELVPMTQTVTELVASPAFYNLSAMGWLTMDALRQLAEDTDAQLTTLTKRIAALEVRVGP